MKKFISLVLCVILLFSVAAIGVSAEHSDSVDNSELVCPINLTAKQKESLYEKIHNAIFNMEKNVDISEFGFPNSQESANYLSGFLKYTKECSPELFCEYVTDKNGSYTFSFNILDNKIISLVLPEFTEHSKEHFTEEYEEFVRLCDDIISEIPNDFTDLEKVLYVHNYLDLHFEYDTTYTIRDAYNFLKQGKGVCQSYTYLFSYLMNKMGIECTEANDDTDLHTWNIVKLDGEWYHIDCTHDDPLNSCEEDIYGHASYSHFLLSDETILTINAEDNQHHEHYSPLTKLFGTEFFAESKKYESADYAWNLADTNLSYCNGAWYFIKNNGATSSLYKTTDFLSCTSLGETITDKWWVKDENTGQNLGYYPDFYSGSVFTYGDEICYSLSKSIIAYNTVTNNSRIIQGINPEDNIYGCTYDRIKGIKISEKNRFEDHNEYITIAMDNHILSDGQVNAQELIAAQKYLLGLSEENFAKYDVCKSYRVTIHDLAMLKKISAGIE